MRAARGGVVSGVLPLLLLLSAARADPEDLDVDPLLLHKNADPHGEQDVYPKLTRAGTPRPPPPARAPPPARPPRQRRRRASARVAVRRP